MNRGVLYFLSGTSHAARLVVSLASLRRHFNGPVLVLSTDIESTEVCRRICGDERLRAEHREIPTDDRKPRKWSYLFKSGLREHSFFDVTLYLDCDTLVLGNVAELFTLPTPRHIVVTQFAEWRTTGGRMTRRIRAWQDTHPELVQPALAFGPAVNTGVFSFSPATVVFERWSEVTKAGLAHFIPDELAMQLLLPHFPHLVLDDRFNRSIRYGRPGALDTRIVHFHGNKHVPPHTLQWMDTFRQACADNLGGIGEWAPADDRQLRQYLAHSGADR